VSIVENQYTNIQEPLRRLHYISATKSVLIYGKGLSVMKIGKEIITQRIED
jgi:hypothetical protein